MARPKPKRRFKTSVPVWVDTPIYDAMIAERDGREPHQFPGWDTWDESEEAQEAYARGVETAQHTPVPWGPKPPKVVTIAETPEGDGPWEFTLPTE